MSCTSLSWDVLQLQLRALHREAPTTSRSEPASTEDVAATIAGGVPLALGFGAGAGAEIQRIGELRDHSGQ